MIGKLMKVYEERIQAAEDALWELSLELEDVDYEDLERAFRLGEDSGLAWKSWNFWFRIVDTFWNCVWTAVLVLGVGVGLKLLGLF